jgi:MerR family copper efflux transcriptional regulator
MVTSTARPLADEETSLLKIGEVAERVGLSLRTIRFYEEAGLVVPHSRTEGGFRLYSVAAVDRLEVIKRMKPLGFSVEEMVEVLGTLDTLSGPATDRAARTALAGQLDAYSERVETKAAELLAEAGRGREFAQHLRTMADRHR